MRFSRLRRRLDSTFWFLAEGREFYIPLVVSLIFFDSGRLIWKAAAGQEPVVREGLTCMAIFLGLCFLLITVVTDVPDQLYFLWLDLNHAVVCRIFGCRIVDRSVNSDYAEQCRRCKGWSASTLRFPFRGPAWRRKA